VSDFELPPVPNYQLQTPSLTVPGYQPPSLGVPQLNLDPTLALGGGTTGALMAALGHLTDPPTAMAPTGTPLAADPPAMPPMQINGNNFINRQIGGVLNPWLANPMGPSEDVQRQLNTIPQIDPGVAAQQTVIHAPTLRW